MDAADMYDMRNESSQGMGGCELAKSEDGVSQVLSFLLTYSYCMFDQGIHICFDQSRSPICVVLSAPIATVDNSKVAKHSTN